MSITDQIPAPVLAVLGAGDLVIERLRAGEAPGLDVDALIGELRSLQDQARRARRDETSGDSSLQAQVRAVPAQAQAAAGYAFGQAGSLFSDLARRGGAVVDRLSGAIDLDDLRDDLEDRVEDIAEEVRDRAADVVADLRETVRDLRAEQQGAAADLAQAGTAVRDAAVPPAKKATGTPTPASTVAAAKKAAAKKTPAATKAPAKKAPAKKAASKSA